MTEKHLDKADANLLFFWPIVLIYLTFQLVSDVTAGKIIAIGSAQVSVTVLYFPVTYIISDILTEVYGYARARRVLWLVLCSSIIAGVIYQIVVFLPPAASFANNDAYGTVFSSVPRILVAGWIAVFAGDILNNLVLAKIKIAMGGRLLFVRTILSTVVGQGLNTSIFYVGALYGTLPNPILIQAILWGWGFKVAVEVAFTPLTYVVVAYLKRKEGIDFYDVKTDFSPLRY